MSGEIWSRVIDGVTVTVDVEATRAAYQTIESGFDCRCDACVAIETALTKLVNAKAEMVLDRLGIDPAKPLEFMFDDESLPQCASLLFDAVGTVEPHTCKTSWCQEGDVEIRFTDRGTRRSEFDRFGNTVCELKLDAGEVGQLLREHA